MRYVILCFVLCGSLNAQVNPFLLIDYFIDLESNEDMFDYLVDKGYKLSKKTTNNNIELSRGTTIITLSSKKCRQISISSNDEFFKEAILFEWLYRNDQYNEGNIENLSRLQWTDSLGREYLVILNKGGNYDMYYIPCFEIDDSKD